jgi:AcrR family transcriptional regulator
MDEYLKAHALRRTPLQQRAKDRCDQVLEASRTLLTEVGLSGFSIPDLATRLEFSRAAIYHFFPTPYAIFNELTRRYLEELEAILRKEAAKLSRKSWQDGARAMAALTARFYNRNPAACILILGGAVTDESYRAQEQMMGRLSDMVVLLFQQSGVKLPKAPPDVPLLTIEIGMTCYRTSFFLHGRVTSEYQIEAGEAMIAYLSRHVG